MPSFWKASSFLEKLFELQAIYGMIVHVTDTVSS